MTWRIYTVHALVLAALCAAAPFAHGQQKATMAPTAAAEEQAAKQDVLLQAMREELEREKSRIELPGMQLPYFIEYRLEDIASYDAQANYGALIREDSGRQRVVRVTVRIGSFASDNSGARGEGTLELGPEDNDASQLRYALWVATDDAYKTALSAYSSKQAALKRFQTAPTANDFTPAKAVVHVEPLVALDLDKAEWKRRIVEASGLYASDPQVRSFAADVQGSSAAVHGVAINRYLVNTEGAVVRKSFTGYEATVSVSGQAADGMQLGRGNGSTAVLAKDLESAAAFRRRAIENLKSLEALRDAPLVDAEDYHGPVLFSAEASADVLMRLFVPNVEADRPEVGTLARTQGAYSSSLRSRVLPEFMSVEDDPLLKSYRGELLLGSYSVDDEGVPAQKVEVAVHGDLESYVLGREPVKDFPNSNGHGRAGIAQAPHSRAGVMLFSTAKPETPAEISAKLLALAKEQGRDVYYVEQVGPDLTPRVLYRVSPQGKRTLVRGATFDELDNRSLRSEIIATGNEGFVDNSLQAVPQTIIAPSLLFADITVKRATEEQQKLPYYGPPSVAAGMMTAAK